MATRFVMRVRFLTQRLGARQRHIAAQKKWSVRRRPIESLLKVSEQTLAAHEQLRKIASRIFFRGGSREDQ